MFNFLLMIVAFIAGIYYGRLWSGYSVWFKPLLMSQSLAAWIRSFFVRAANATVATATSAATAVNNTAAQAANSVSTAV
jgi:hypothetical protein